MAATPDGKMLGTRVSVGAYPTRTWRADRGTGRLSGFTDGLDAMRQAVDIALNVRRFRWQIYTPNVGHEFEAVGFDFETARIGLQAQIQEALAADERITGLEDFHCQRSGDGMYASFTVKTIFGDLAAEVRL